MKKDDEGEQQRSVFWDDQRPTVSGVRCAVAAVTGRVLLVDQYPDWLGFMGFILRRRGHEIFCAQKIEHGRAILESEPLDVVVCGLTEQGGMSLLREAKKLGHIHTVALSLDGTDLRGLPRGTVDMPLLRPVPILSLVETIESFLPMSPRRLG